MKPGHKSNSPTRKPLRQTFTIIVAFIDCLMNYFTKSISKKKEGRTTLLFFEERVELLLKCWFSYLRTAFVTDALDEHYVSFKLLNSLSFSTELQNEKIGTIGIEPTVARFTVHVATRSYTNVTLRSLTILWVGRGNEGGGRPYGLGWSLDFFLWVAWGECGLVKIWLVLWHVIKVVSAKVSRSRCYTGKFCRVDFPCGEDRK